jgi:hypothetical protein
MWHYYEFDRAQYLHKIMSKHKPNLHPAFETMHAANRRKRLIRVLCAKAETV